MRISDWSSDVCSSDLVQLHVRPEIDELDAGVGRADTVDTPETLDDAHRIPVDVVIHEEIAVLKVLAFGNAVRADEKVNLALARHFLRPLLGAGRKGAQARTTIRAQAGQAGFVCAGAADHAEVDAKRRMRPARKLAVLIVESEERRVGKECVSKCRYRLLTQS